MTATKILIMLMILAGIMIGLNSCSHWEQLPEENKEQVIEIAFKIGMTLADFLLKNQGIEFSSSRDIAGVRSKTHDGIVYLFEMRGGRWIAFAQMTIKGFNDFQRAEDE